MSRCPYPPYGTLNYFDQTASQVLDRIYNYRHTAILPQQTGPVLDVLYSAAGNSRGRGVLQPRHHRLRLRDRRLEGPGQRHLAGHRLPAVLRRVGDRRRHRHLQRQPRQRGPRRGHGVRQRQLRAARAPRCEYAKDTTAPTVTATGASVSNSRAGREVHDRRGRSIYYTHDGSTPDHGLDGVEAEPPREKPDPVAIVDDATLKWIAVDFKGNTSAVQSKTFLIDTGRADDLAHRRSPTAQVFTQGRPVPRDVHLRR